MNKSLYAVGTFALALFMGGVPAIALAENDSDNGLRVTAQVTAQTQGTNVTTGVSASLGEDGEDAREQQEQKTVREQQKQQLEASATARVQDADDDQEEIRLELEDDKDIAFSLDDLKKKIENRKQELDDEEASTTVKSREIVKNANEVRLAVHILLASKELLGGIGQQVSEIAKGMNDSVATMTSAEAQIQARSFFSNLFFGGDSAAAGIITQAVAQNQQRIDDLTKLLGEANVSADIKIVLKAQVAAIQDAQTRLQDLAQKEKKMWGFFSWRF